MTVLAISLLECAFYGLGLVSVLLVWASGTWPMLVYVNAGVLLVMLYLQIAAIPLNLNWSRESYGYLLERLLVFVLFTPLIYAGHYNRSGAVGSSFEDALYFSLTTWTTLGYGDITVASPFKLATSIEALTGLLTIAVLASMVWLYCQERFHPVHGSERRRGLSVRADSVFGGWREIESEKVAQERAERQKRLRLDACSRCGNTGATIEKFYDIVGRLAPIPNFVVICGCGEHTKPVKNAYLAAYRWNKGRTRAARHKVV